MVGAKHAENKPGHRRFETYDVPEWVRHPLKEQPLKLALIFPGEQSHYVGMLGDVRDQPAVKGMLDTATQVLGFDVAALMADGPVARMRQVRFDQCLTYVAGCVAFEVLRESDADSAQKCQAVAGLGVGECVALYAAGVVTYAQGLELVRARAEALDDLSAEVQLEALVVRGLDHERLERHMKTAQKIDVETGGRAELHILRYDCPEGYVCGGKRSTLLSLQATVEQESGVETRLLPDPVHAGYTPLAEPAARKVAAAIDRLLPSMKPPRCELYLNRHGRRIPPGRHPQAWAAALREQLLEPIQWEACVTQMLNWGVRQFYECGPNRSLRFLMGFFEHLIEAPLEVLRPADFTWTVSV